VCVVALTTATGAGAQPSSVVGSAHNLSASGPGGVRAATEEQVCIFCHAPHNATPVRPLWNRAMPVEPYAIYTSRALDAAPGQPTGMSKMCLSCHDGTIALGSVVSRGTPILMSGGATTLPPGASNLGTDLRDDHPVSFRYDGALAAQDPHVRDPALLPPRVRLDANNELQCTTCHDAHDNSLGDFLVMHNSDSQLCNACHQVGTTTITAHAGCAACHQPHTAPSGPYLLRRQTISETCLSCHDGGHPPAANIAPELNKFATHDTRSPVDPPEPIIGHATCADCHEPHTMNAGGGQAPAVHPNFGRLPGLSASGSPIAAANYEYEACFRCHADGNTLPPWIGRRIAQNNTRLEFSPSAVSFHPIQAPGRNPNVPSLRAGWSPSSMVYCSDCHTSDTGGPVAGSGPGGTHGSNFAPLLAARYDTADFTSENAQAYALCYQCHDRASILNNESYAGHRLHVVDQRTPCAACHDAHGIASSQGTATGNSHLINFATGIVLPDQGTGRLEFRDTGVFSGECFLSCHGHTHSPSRYP
jgi:predicted CXXCH cytochrome family protein